MDYLLMAYLIAQIAVCIWFARGSRPAQNRKIYGILARLNPGIVEGA